MSRGTSALFVTLAVTCLASCEAASGPCKDGREPDRYILVLCSPSGTDLSCTATKKENGVCAEDDVDETNVATWASSDTSVAVMTTPGKFHVVASGQVEITAKYLGILQSEPHVWLVSTVSPPERLHLMVFHANRSSGGVLPGVQISVTPERGPTPQCITDIAGVCSVYVFKVAGEIVATKDGFAQVKVSYLPNWTGVTTSKIITLTPN